VPPAFTQAFGEAMQSKPLQPLSFVRGTIFPSGQKPGAGGEGAGQEMQPRRNRQGRQHCTPMPAPHEYFEASPT